jgi:hypothetical protein
LTGETRLEARTNRPSSFVAAETVLNFGLLAACKAAGDVGTLCSNTIFDHGRPRTLIPTDEGTQGQGAIHHIDWDQCEMRMKKSIVIVDR